MTRSRPFPDKCRHYSLKSLSFARFRIRDFLIVPTFRVCGDFADVAYPTPLRRGQKSLPRGEDC